MQKYTKYGKTKMITITTHEFDNGLNFHASDESNSVSISLNFVSDGGQTIELSKTGKNIANVALLPLLSQLLTELNSK